jgi:hypothetical protein
MEPFMPGDIISAVYDAPVSDRPWLPLFPMLRDVVNARRVMLKFTPPGTRDALIFSDTDGDEHGPTELYRRLYQFQDPVSYDGMAPGDLLQLEELVDCSAHFASDFYRHFCEPLGIEHGFLFYLGRHAEIDVWLSGSRSADHGQFSESELGALRGLYPHLCRAVHVYCVLIGAKLQAAMYADSLSSLGLGVALLDAHGRLISANAEAEAILSLSTGISWPGHRFLPNSVRRELDGALRRLERDEKLQHDTIVMESLVPDSKLSAAIPSPCDAAGV